jgi:hypothetical protein
LADRFYNDIEVSTTIETVEEVQLLPYNWHIVKSLASPKTLLLGFFASLA